MTGGEKQGKRRFGLVGTRTPDDYHSPPAVAPSERSR